MKPNDKSHEDAYYIHKRKMEICLELCGMTKEDIKYIMEFPMCFLELALAIMYNSEYSQLNINLSWLDTLWDKIKLQLENDFESFSEAKFLKQTYYQVNDSKVKDQLKMAMEWYAKELVYLKSELGKEINKEDLINLIKNHYYELSRQCTTEEIKRVNPIKGFKQNKDGRIYAKGTEITKGCG